MNASDMNEVAQAMVVDEVDGLDPEDKFKLSLQEKFAVHRAMHGSAIDGAHPEFSVHRAMHGSAIDGAHPEFYMAVAKARRRLVAYVENNRERIPVDIEQLYEQARQLGNLDAAFRQLFERRVPGHVVDGPFRCNFAYAHWAEGPMD
jgi:hypothetical protein